MKRWLVIFHSHPVPPSDFTVVDVRAATELHAIRAAARKMPPQHPWSFVQACAWPRECSSIDEAAALYTSPVPRLSFGAR